MKNILLSLLFLLSVVVVFGQTATSGVTVITHGFSAFKDDAFGLTEKEWMENYADAVLDRVGGGKIYINHFGTGTWEFMKEKGLGNHTVLIYNWGTVSDIFSDGWLEASADGLFALLMNPPNGMSKENFWDNSYKKHFIGHSRGAVLLLQLFHRLNKYDSNILINQFTALDPHPASLMNDQNLPYVSVDPLDNSRYILSLPPNIVRCDNYYRTDNNYEGISDLGAFDGVRITGATNLQLNNTRIDEANCDGGVLACAGYAHSKVPSWYYGTINTTATNYGNLSIPSNYYTSGYSIGNFNEENRESVGWNLSIFSGNTLNGAITTTENTIIPEKIFNSNIRYANIINLAISSAENGYLPGWKGNRGSTSWISVSNGVAKFTKSAKKQSSISHSVLYFPSNASKLRVKARAYSNSGKNLLKVAIKDYKQSSKGSKSYSRNISSDTWNYYDFTIPVSLQGKSGSISLMNGLGEFEVDEIYFINANGTNLRQGSTQVIELDLAASHLDFPVEYIIGPNPLIKGERPTSFNATITNTMPRFWSGTLKMYWRKVSEDGRGILLKSQAINLAPGTGVTLDRGTDFIISEPDDYILGIYANNDDVPIDEYFFYVEDQQTDEVSTPTVSVTPSESTHTFGSVVVGSTDGQTFNIKNTSNANVNITGVSITGTGFSAGTSTCCGTLAPNQSYDVKVNTSPTAATVYTGQMQISGNFTGSSITVALSTQGVYNTPPVTGCLSASVSAVSIQSGNTDDLKKQYFGLTNNSLTGSVNITGVSFTGADASYFSYDGNLFSIPSSLAPAMTTGFLVKFNNPQSTTRTYNANLVFTTNNASCPTLTIPVSATHTPSQLSWLSPLTDATYEIGTGGTINNIPLRWQGYIPAANGNVPPVEIQYTIDGGLTWTSRISNPVDECTTGHNNADPTQNVIYFGINDFAGKDIQFRIKPCYENTTPWQYSAIAHVIAPGQQTLQVLYPNGYEIFNAGQNVKIKWANYIGYKAVNLSYSIDNGLTYNSIASNISGQATEYNWTVPTGVNSEYCKIMISAANISDVSDYTFYIQTAPATPILVTNINVRPEGCKTTPEGNITYTVTGGTPTYYPTIRKLSDIDNTVNLSNGTLFSGEYLCIITDNNNKRTSFNFTIPKQTPFTYNVITQNDTCSGSKGSILLNVGSTFGFPGNFSCEKNGTQIYSGLNRFVSNLSAGYYTLTIKDEQQCGYTENIYLDSSPGTYFNLTSTVTNTSCSGNTGAISLNTGAAQSPTYLWSNSATTQNISNLASGQYSVNVIDATGCMQNRTVDILESGGWLGTVLGNYIANPGISLGTNVIYFPDHTPTNSRLGIISIPSHSYDYISYTHPTNPTWTPSFGVTSFENGKIATKVNFSNETHFLLFNAATKAMDKRLIVNSAKSYSKMILFGSKVYCQDYSNNLDIWDLTSNTLSSIALTSGLYDIEIDKTANKAYVVNFDSQLQIINLATNLIESTKNLSGEGYLIKKVAQKLCIVYDPSNSANYYLDVFDMANNLNKLATLQVRNPNLGSSMTFKASNLLFIPTVEQTTQVIDLDNYTVKNEIAFTSNLSSLVYDSITDRVYGSSAGIKYFTNSQFDYTTSKTDATCGQNNGSITLTIPNDGKTYSYLWSNGTTTKDVSGLSAGSYTVTVTQSGGCAVKKTISIVQSSTAINAPIGIATSRCGAGSVTLGASGCSGTYTWYAAETGGSSLGTSSNFVTSSITTTTSYYVDCAIGGCVSARALVLATVNAIPSAPTIPTTTINSGQTATLTASGCNGTVTWFGVNTGGNAIYTGNPFTSPILSVNTNYYAECSSNSCVSQTRGIGTVTVNAISCPMPTGMQWAETFPTSFRPYWQGVAGNNYVVRYRITGTTNWTETALIPCTQTGLVITTLSGLTNGQTYEWQVKTVCSGTNSSIYSTSTFSATYCRAATLTAPTGTNLTATTANIQWYNGTPSNVNLRWKVANTTMWFTVNNVASTQIWLSNLVPNSLYEVQIQTICSDGTLSSFSNSVNFTTLSCPTSMVFGLGYFSTGTYKIGQTISSIATINTGTTIYNAGNSITLSPGFNVPNGAVFKAEIKVCN